jgi:hypothetical protein
LPTEDEEDEMRMSTNWVVLIQKEKNTSYWFKYKRLDARSQHIKQTHLFGSFKLFTSFDCFFLASLSESELSELKSLDESETSKTVFSAVKFGLSL